MAKSGIAAGLAIFVCLAPAASAQAPDEKQVQLAVNRAMVAAYHEWGAPNAWATVKKVVSENENQAEAILYYEVGSQPGVSEEPGRAMMPLSSVGNSGTGRALLRRGADGTWFVTEIRTNDLHCKFGCLVKVAVPPAKSRSAKRQTQGGSGAQAPPPSGDPTERHPN